MDNQQTRQLAKNAEKIEALMWQYPEGIALAELTSKTMVSTPAAKEALKVLHATLENGLYVLPDESTEKPKDETGEPERERARLGTQDRLVKLLLEYRKEGITAISACSLLEIDEKAFRTAISNIRGRVMKVKSVKRDGETRPYYFAQPNHAATCKTAPEAPPAEQKAPEIESPAASLEYVDPYEQPPAQTSAEPVQPPKKALPENMIEVKQGVFMMQPTPETAPAATEKATLMASKPKTGWAFMTPKGEQIGMVWENVSTAIAQMEADTGQTLEQITEANQAYLAKFEAVVSYRPVFALGLGAL